MRDYTNFERCNGEPCCVFAERICADNYKELLEKGKDSNGEEVFGEMLDDLLYLDRKSTRLNSSHTDSSRMPSSA